MRSLEVNSNSFAVIYRMVDLSIIIAVHLAILYAYQLSFSKNYLILLLSQLIIFIYIAEGAQLYRSWRANRFSRMLWNVLLCMTISFMLILAVLFALKLSESYSRVLIVSWYVVSCLLLMSWRLIFRGIRDIQRQHGINVQKVAIVGLTPRGISLYHEINAHPELGFQFIGFFDDRDGSRFPEEYQHLLVGTVSEAVMTAQSGVISRLYICLPLKADRRISYVIEQLGDTTLDVLLVPELVFMHMMHGRLGNVGDIDTISVFESPHLGLQSYLKRSFDLVFSSIALLVLLPLLILIAIAIKVSSGGPVLFRQDRYGLDGKKIGVYKFRSMKVTENSDTVVQVTKADDRVTPLGRLLRRTSLDELPQFINVLLGDMSVVGPRPHAVAHNEHYRNQVSFYMLRHKVRPGITGWAQVNGFRGETDTLDKMEKRVEHDLAYIKNWSLWWDVKIIWLTLFRGFSDKNAY